jgi:hypothetical protein
VQPPQDQLHELVAKWRSGKRAEELREVWNEKRGPDSDVAGGILDGILDCADELEQLLSRNSGGTGT